MKTNIKYLAAIVLTFFTAGVVYGASPTFFKDISVKSTIAFSITTNSTATGSSQDVAITTPITLLTNASLTSVRNFSGNLGASQIVVKNGKASGTITLINNSGGTASNRILTGTGADLDIPAGAGVSLFYDTVNSKWQVYGGSGGGGAAVNYQDYTKIAAPAAGAAGTSRLFVNTDGRPYFEDENAFFTDIGGAHGTVGNREYISNTNARYGTTGWNLYNDSAAAPVDMTGGTTTGLTLTRTTSGGEYVAESQGFKLAKDAANRQGLGVSTDITIDPVNFEGQKPVWVSFNYKTSANFATGDLICYAYDSGTPGTVMKLTGGAAAADAGIIQASTTTANFTGFFTPSSSTSAAYRIGCHVATTNALAWNFFFGKVHAGSINFVPGVAAADLGNESWVTNQANAPTASVYLYREGNRIIAVGTVSFTSTASSGGLIITIPAKYAPNSTVYNSFGPVGSAGPVTFLDTGINSYEGFARINSATALELVPENAGGTYLTTSAVAAAVPFSWGSGDKAGFTATWVVAGWSVGNTVATNELALTTPAPTTTTSATKTPGSSGIYHSLTTNSIALTPGTWRLTGQAAFLDGGVTPTYSNVLAGWFAANGADSASVPAALSTASGLTVLSATESSIAGITSGTPNSSGLRLALNPITVKVTQNVTIYLVSFSAQTTSSNARVTVYGTAEKVQDLTVVGLVPGGPPTVQRFTSGTSATYTTPAGVRYLKIRMVGGGGGGAGSGTTPGAAGDGGDTIFGSFTASKGAKAVTQTSGAGGVPSTGDVNVTGGDGQSGTGSASQFGGSGGASFFGGVGYGGTPSGGGKSAAANTGSGGGGAGDGATVNAGAGGGAGGYIEKFITSPAATYTYSVGIAGTAGTAGTSGFAGGAGAAGQIIVEEYY